ncbi:MAG: hypothetical protein NTZ33_05300 [Bacteroidetes bacterium]|nr:hypothetical protein [Bacteroidota bacterium]
MKKIFFLLVFVMLINSSIAQKKIEANNLGINAGFTTGLGLSYEYWPEKDGFQITFLPWISKENTRFSFAFTYFRNLTIGKSVDLFLFMGNHITNILTKDNPGNNPHTIYNFGIGPGLKYNEDQIVWQFMFGYAMIDVLGDCNTSVALEIGVFYNF